MAPTSKRKPARGADAAEYIIGASDSAGGGTDIEGVYGRPWSTFTPPGRGAARASGRGRPSA
eukprot:6661810-Lingulodinium_polyedra.AAC.1